MWFFSVLLTLEIASVLIAYFAVQRLYAYIYRYRFDESVYTLLFRFVRLRYIAWLYGGSVLGAALIGGFFAFSYLTYGGAS